MSMKRIKVKLKKPNPLFESWLEEWMNEAASKNSDLRYHFSKALNSLKKYPLPLNSGKDCLILQHFGTKLCSMLDKKLDEYKTQNKDAIGIDDNFVCTNCENDEKDYASKRKKNNQCEGTVGLCIQNQPELSGFAVPELSQSNNARSTRMSSPTKIIEKFNGSPVKGKSNNTKSNKKKLPEATKASKTTKNNAVNKMLSKPKEDSDNSKQQNIYLQAKEFDIILLVDKQETCGGKTKPQHDTAISELTQLGVQFEVRHLKVGDFTWIARCKFTNAELVLPYIVERKRIDDLSSSITDGRFYEQKFRLKRSGIENLMYIVEEYDKNYRTALPHASLMQAAINSTVQDGFVLKYTKNHKDTMFYLSSLTRILNQLYKEKTLIGCKKEDLVRTDLLSMYVGLMEFGEFNKAASKQKVFKVSQMFVRQLLQLKGMSVEKAMAIVERYSTPRLLVDVLTKSDGNGELLLANIQFGDKKRLLGPAISKTVYQLYTRKNLS